MSWKPHQNGRNAQINSEFCFTKRIFIFSIIPPIEWSSLYGVLRLDMGEFRFLRLLYRVESKVKELKICYVLSSLLDPTF